MSVSVIQQVRSNKVSFLKKIAEKFCSVNKLPANLTIILVGDRKITELNKRYRGINRSTDILSFRESDSEISEENYLGELFFNLSYIKRSVKKNQLDFNHEIAFILVHGLLHLIGYDDKNFRQAKLMDQLTNDFLNKYYDKIQKIS